MAERIEGTVAGLYGVVHGQFGGGERAFVIRGQDLPIVSQGDLVASYWEGNQCVRLAVLRMNAGGPEVSIAVIGEVGSKGLPI
jgi:hypothetical protein